MLLLYPKQFRKSFFSDFKTVDNNILDILLIQMCPYTRLRLFQILQKATQEKVI